MDIRSASPRSMEVVQTQRLWVHRSIAVEGQGSSAFTDLLSGLRRPRKSLKAVYFDSRLRHKNIGLLKQDEASSSWALQCACTLLASATAIEAVTVSTPRSRKETTKKLTPVKKTKVLPLETTPISLNDTSVLVRPPSTACTYEELPLYNPSNKIVSYFQQLGLKGLALNRCLKRAFEISEDDLMKLLATFRSYGLQRGDFRSMLSKYPTIVQVERSQVEQVFRFFSRLGFSCQDWISLCVKRPALIACDVEKASQIIELLLSLGIQKQELLVTLSKRPHILEHNVDVVQSAVSALLKARVPQTDVTRLLQRSPIIFTPTVQENIESSVEFWVSIGVEGRDLTRALSRRPNLLSYDISSMLGTYQYLHRWVQPDDLTKLVRRYAELLALDPEVRLQPLIGYILSLGVKEKDLGKIILRRPQLMTCAIPCLERTVEYLKSLGVKEVMLGKIITLSPQVFTLNAEDKLKRGVEFFRSIGLDKERDMEFLFSRNAQILCCSIERNLRPKFEFFVSIGLSKEAIAKMIVLFPSMLGQNIDSSLAPKYQYLIVDMKRTVQELVDFPQYFGYSLEKRIKPRHKQLSEVGIQKSLPSMLACTDIEFHKRYIDPCPWFSQAVLKHEEQVGSQPSSVIEPKKMSPCGIWIHAFKFDSQGNFCDIVC